MKKNYLFYMLGAYRNRKRKIGTFSYILKKNCNPDQRPPPHQKNRNSEGTNSGVYQIAKMKSAFFVHDINNNFFFQKSKLFHYVHFLQK